MFHWDAAPGERVAGRRFWIYLAVSLPITILTLMALFIWMSIADKASSEKTRVRDILHERAIKTWDSLRDKGFLKARPRPKKSTSHFSSDDQLEMQNVPAQSQS